MTFLLILIPLVVIVLLVGIVPVLVGIISENRRHRRELDGTRGSVEKDYKYLPRRDRRRHRVS